MPKLPAYILDPRNRVDMVEDETDDNFKWANFSN